MILLRGSRTDTPRLLSAKKYQRTSAQTTLSKPNNQEGKTKQRRRTAQGDESRPANENKANTHFHLHDTDLDLIIPSTSLLPICAIH